MDGKKYSDTELLGIVVDLGRGKSADELRGLHRLDADTARLLVEQWEASGATLRSVCEQLAQVQRALEGSEGRYRRITQAVTDYVFTVRVENGVVVDTVHGLGCAAVTGYTTEDFAANPMLWVNMVDERDRQSVVDHAQKLLSGKPVDAIEHRIVRKDGVRRWVRNTPVQHFDANGRLTSYDGLIRDITEQKRAEEALRASEARFRAIFERAGLGITLVNVQGELIDCNLVFERMLDYSHEEIMALGLVNVTQPEDVANDWREFKDLITGKREHYQTEKRFVRKDGGILWGRVTVSLIRDVDGAPQYGIGLVEDITERKRSEEERRYIEQRMQHAQRIESLSVLAGGIAHDFNNLLMAILGNADLALMDMPPDALGRRHVEEIEAAARRAAELSAQMLAYSGHGRFDVQPVDLSKVVAEAAQALAIVTPRQVAVNYEYAPELPAVEGDPGQLCQVVLSLATNGVEALGNGAGKVTVRTYAIDADRDYLASTYVDDHLPAGRYAAVEVVDNGCGMDTATLARAFDPFFTTKFTGRGLGLAATLGIVRGHRGALKVVSEPGRGSTFTVLFPEASQLP